MKKTKPSVSEIKSVLPQLLKEELTELQAAMDFLNRSSTDVLSEPPEPYLELYYQALKKELSEVPPLHILLNEKTTIRQLQVLRQYFLESHKNVEEFIITIWKKCFDKALRRTTRYRIYCALMHCAKLQAMNTAKHIDGYPISPKTILKELIDISGLLSSAFPGYPAPLVLRRILSSRAV